MLSTNATFAEFEKFMQKQRGIGPFESIPIDQTSVMENEKSDSFKKFLNSLNLEEIERFMCNGFSVLVQVAQGVKVQDVADLECRVTETKGGMFRVEHQLGEQTKTVKIGPNSKIMINFKYDPKMKGVRLAK